MNYPDPALEDESVTLRAWELDDVECVRQGAEDPRIAQHTSLPAHYTLDAAHVFIRHQWAHNDDGEALSLVIVDRRVRAPVGSMFMSTEERVMTIGYWLVPAARRRGLSTHAISLTAEWALDQGDVEQVDAIVRPDNLPSIRALEGAGFTLRPAPDHIPNLRYARNRASGRL